MKRIVVAAAISLAFGATGAMAANDVQLSESECTALWQQANPNNASGLTKSQAVPYVANFNAANPDGDKTIDSTEWMAACGKGLIRSSANTGASSGSSGSSDSGSSKSGGSSSSDMKQE